MTTALASTPAISVGHVLSRLNKIKRRSQLPLDALEQAYWGHHPRMIFQKTAPHGGRFLDIGAGSGGMGAWRGWLSPNREDLRMYGVDLQRGDHADLFEAWEIVNLDEAKPDFGGVEFDAIFTSHVIEHVADPAAMLKWAASRARPGAPVYVEWPSEASTQLPSRADLELAGFDVEISNFYDDATHLQRPSRADVIGWLQDAGFEIVSEGVIDMGWLGEEMLAVGREQNNQSAIVNGYWSVFGWADLVTARKPLN